MSTPLARATTASSALSEAGAQSNAVTASAPSVAMDMRRWEAMERDPFGSGAKRRVKVRLWDRPRGLDAGFATDLVATLGANSVLSANRSGSVATPAQNAAGHSPNWPSLAMAEWRRRLTRA